MVESVFVNRWAWDGVVGRWKLVGHDEPYDTCGAYKYVEGCLDVGAHAGVHFDKMGVPVDTTGMMYGRLVHRWCGRPVCRKCFRHGWVHRQSSDASARLADFSKGLGEILHISVSPPLAVRYLPLKVVEKMLYKLLKSLGIDGCSVVHGLRYHDKYEALVRGSPLGWYDSLHFHVLGFIDGGYGHCRNCKYKGLKCDECVGFEGRVRRAFKGNGGWIVKVLGKRKTVEGTLAYELGHATVEVGSKRFHVLKWFGRCGYRSLTDEMKASIRQRLTIAREKFNRCPLCGKGLVKIWRVSAVGFVVDVDKDGYVGRFVEPLFDDCGEACWVEAGERRVVYGKGTPFFGG